MKIEVAQLDLVLGDKERNLEKAMGIIEDSGAELILFPEVFTSGFDFPNLWDLAEAPDGGTVRLLQEACGDKLVAGSIVEKEGENLYNVFLLIGEDGLVASYRKMHVFRKEKEYFSPGEEIVVKDTPIGKVGLATCYDLRFPEMFREMTDAGLVLVCANFPRPRKDHWTTLLKARAIENQFFVVACNRVGKDEEKEYFGKSVIIDPWGKILAEGEEREEILSYDIDLSQVKKTRKDFPVLEDRLL